MTKDELITVLSIAGVDPKTIDAMVQSYDMGFEHGALAARGIEALVDAAAETIRSFDAGGDPYTGRFWDEYNKLRAMT